jgi:hypothetical protein
MTGNIRTGGLGIEHPARDLQPTGIRIEAEQILPDGFEVLLAALQLLRHGVDVTKSPFERVRGKDRGCSRGMIGGVDDIA